MIKHDKNFRYKVRKKLCLRPVLNHFDTHAAPVQGVYACKMAAGCKLKYGQLMHEDEHDHHGSSQLQPVQPDITRQKILPRIELKWIVAMLCSAWASASIGLGLWVGPYRAILTALPAQLFAAPSLSLACQRHKSQSILERGNMG